MNGRLKLPPPVPQYMEWVIWGLSSALHEVTDIDAAPARYSTDNLADQMIPIPVNADVPSIEIIVVAEQDDKANPLGITRSGEVGIVGVNATVANAVFHATGGETAARAPPPGWKSSSPDSRIEAALIVDAGWTGKWDENA